MRVADSTALWFANHEHFIYRGWGTVEAEEIEIFLSALDLAKTDEIKQMIQQDPTFVAKVQEEKAKISQHQWVQETTERLRQALLEGNVDETKSMAARSVPFDERQTLNTAFQIARKTENEELSTLIFQLANTFSHVAFLYNAIMQKDTSTVKFLLSKNKELVRTVYHTEFAPLTPLHLAAQMDNSEMVKIFLENGIESVRLLLGFGASSDAISRSRGNIYRRVKDYTSNPEIRNMVSHLSR